MLRGRLLSRFVAATLGALLIVVAPDAAATVDFEDLPLSGGYYNGSDGAGGFVTAQGVAFNNSYTDFGGGFEFWNGWAYSNVVNTTTPGFANQYASYAGGGLGGAGKYGVGFQDDFAGVNPIITLPQTAVVQSVRVTNSTYTALSMRDGDAFAKKFGGPTGLDPDWFLLTITGRDAAGGEVGSVPFYLADFRPPGIQTNGIVQAWAQVDLTGLGAVRSLEFSMTSSDTGDFGMNTPAYFALDQLVFGATAIPGDATGDGRVSASDYSVWRANYGQFTGAATQSQGDFTGDRRVSAADYAVWADHFQPGAGAIVPEPATWTLLAFGALACGLLRRGARARIISP